MQPSSPLCASSVRSFQPPKSPLMVRFRSFRAFLDMPSQLARPAEGDVDLVLGCEGLVRSMEEGSAEGPAQSESHQVRTAERKMETRVAMQRVVAASLALLGVAAGAALMGWMLLSPISAP